MPTPPSDANIGLLARDRLNLPQYTSTVKINGAVMYPTTVAYQKGKMPVLHQHCRRITQNARKNMLHHLHERHGG
jgi:hypothetical protein